MAIATSIELTMAYRLYRYICKNLQSSKLNLGDKMEIVKHPTKSPEEIVKQLRLAGSTNPLVGLVMKKFADRIRNRNTVTPGAIKLAMSKNDHNYPKVQYAEVLKLLASVGLGKLDLGPRGQIRALNRIPLDLKVIGQMYHRNIPLTPLEHEVSPLPIISKQTPQAELNTVDLIVKVAGQQVPFAGVNDLDNEELGAFLQSFFALCRKFNK